MTDTELNIAIARACGWQRYHRSGWDTESSMPFVEEGWQDGAGNRLTMGIPNYCHDLNAMNDAETLLTDAQWQGYFDLLVEARCGSARNPSHNDYPKVVHASARQRAEAFWQTIRNGKN